MNKLLRHGYTTGACAAAAAKGAAMMLRDRHRVDNVTIILPAGEEATFELRGQQFSADEAWCHVVKDGGDDPDVTNGVEVHARLRLVRRAEGGAVQIEGGTGIGRVTKPGLAVPVGEWAINPVPRRMIEEAVRGIFPSDTSWVEITVTISIPDGAERARRTLNERLGIVGGLSILGTTGIVKPISAKAWTDTIETAIEVALASGSRTVVLSTGRSSEQVAMEFFASSSQPLRVALPEESFVMMGDHVGYALRACARKGVPETVLAGQFAKLLKVACGHEQTHVASSEVDLQLLRQWVAHSGLAVEIPEGPLNTARQVLENSGYAQELVTLVCDRVHRFVDKVVPALPLKVLLAGYRGEVLYFG